MFRLCLLPGEQITFYSEKNIPGFDLTLYFFQNQECQKKLEHKLGLDSYLLKPVQRITKYQLLLKVHFYFFLNPFRTFSCPVFEPVYVFSEQEMLKYSKTCEGANDLQEALTSILGILKAVNDSMHLIAITGYEVSPSNRRFFIKNKVPGMKMEVRDEMIVMFRSKMLLCCCFERRARKELNISHSSEVRRLPVSHLPTPPPQGNLSELGKLLMQGSFSVWTEHKKGHAKVKDLARFKPMQRHLFLHEKALLFCKRREENGEGYEKAPSYSFKHSLSVSPLQSQIIASEHQSASMFSILTLLS